MMSGRKLVLHGRLGAKPDGVWVTEIWDSAEDRAASLKLPATQQLITETMPLIGAMPERSAPLFALGGKSL